MKRRFEEAPLWVNGIWFIGYGLNQLGGWIAKLGQFRWPLMDRFCKCSECLKRRKETL